MIKIKRVYDAVSEDDGTRVLIDRLWPRGLSKDKAKVDLWFKDIAPSDALRKWFGHRDELWKEFQERYKKELKTKKDELTQLKIMEQKGSLTLLYSAKDETKNNAIVLKRELSHLGYEV